MPSQSRLSQDCTEALACEGHMLVVRVALGYGAGGHVFNTSRVLEDEGQAHCLTAYASQQLSGSLRSSYIWERPVEERARARA